jgi:dTDP-4-amino-4,6-dideoxygalactose transaminase
MKDIGGYFGLEVEAKSNFDKKYTIALNSCRNALLLLLQHYKYKKIHIPYFTCEVIIDVIKCSGVDYSFYNINKDLEIQSLEIKSNEPILYTNYFGLKDNYIKDISKKYANIIVDNAQAFYSSPIDDNDTIYSPRKFFGLPDGGGLFTKSKIDVESYPSDHSYDRFSHLLKRIDLSAGAGYSDFRENDASLRDQPIKRMSKLTTILLNAIDQGLVKEIRRDNFNYLHNKLSEENKLKLNIHLDSVPLVYPFLIDNGKKIKKALIDKKVYVATYWNEVLNLVDDNSVEADLVNNLVAIPIDQRYSTNEMDYILTVIQSAQK